MAFRDPDGQLAAERLIPSLQGSDYEPQSNRNPAYNCFAWAAHDHENWMEPPGTAAWTSWPSDLPTWPTLENYMRAYEREGFVECPDGTLESGYEKIALFIDDDGAPQHAARQLPSGRWTSKLGKGIDIEHDLATLVGEPAMGNVEKFMKRRCPGRPPDPPAGLLIATELPRNTEDHS